MSVSEFSGLSVAEDETLTESVIDAVLVRDLSVVRLGVVGSEGDLVGLPLGLLVGEPVLDGEALRDREIDRLCVVDVETEGDGVVLGDPESGSVIEVDTLRDGVGGGVLVTLKVIVSVTVADLEGVRVRDLDAERDDDGEWLAVGDADVDNQGVTELDGVADALAVMLDNRLADFERLTGAVLDTEVDRAAVVVALVLLLADSL